MIKEILLAVFLVVAGGDKIENTTPQCPPIIRPLAVDEQQPYSNIYYYRDGNQLFIINTSKIFAIDYTTKTYSSYKNKKFGYDIRSSESDLFDLKITKDDPEIKIETRHNITIDSEGSVITIEIIEDEAKATKIINDLYIRMQYYGAK